MSLDLKIDSEFESIIPPLTDEEFQQLEENIISEGSVLDALIVWNGFIIDGHNRYKVIKKHPDIKFDIHEKAFANRFEALSWICKNQLGRRNLTPYHREYLVGKRYDIEKGTHGGNRKSKGKSSDQVGHLKTRQRIAAETNTSESYVDRAGRFANGIDAAEEVLPGIKQETLSGQIKPTKTDIMAIAKAPVEQRRQMAEDLRLTREQRLEKAGKMRDIRAVAADMTAPKEPVNEIDILESMKGSAMIMIQACAKFFDLFPRLLTEEAYQKQSVEIMKEPYNYILNKIDKTKEKENG